MKLTKLLLCFFLVAVIACSPALVRAQYNDKDGYKLGPEDVIEISVWGDKDLIREVVVRPDGGISFPLAGDLNAGGLTVEQVREEITKRIVEYIPDASVTVILRKVVSPKIFVMGKVKNPGMFTLGQNMSVVQALAMAGGLSPFAEAGSIIVVRQVRSGGQKAISFDYDDISEGEALETNIMLEPGDTVVVP